MDNKTLTTIAAYADANKLLRAQRDELAAALREIEDWADRHCLFGISTEGENVLRIARAALAKVQGQ